jgi:hypothetical protein
MGVHRLKRGLDVEHPIAGDELRAIKRYIAIRTEALDSAGDLLLYVVADNPIGEHHSYPDSKKWGVGIPERRGVSILRAAAARAGNARINRGVCDVMGRPRSGTPPKTTRR